LTTDAQHGKAVIDIAVASRNEPILIKSSFLEPLLLLRMLIGSPKKNRDVWLVSYPTNYHALPAAHKIRCQATLMKKTLAISTAFPETPTNFRPGR